jgi:hypothetical protein
MKQEHIDKAVAIWAEGPKEMKEGEYHSWYNRLSVSFVKSFQECGYATILRYILGLEAIEPEDQGKFPRVPEWEAAGNLVESYVFEGEKGKKKMFEKYKNNFCNLTKLKKTPSEVVHNVKYLDALNYAEQIMKQKYIMKFIKHKDSEYHTVIEFEIDGVPMKCETDCLNLVVGFELDFKTAADINADVYNRKTRKWQSFIQAGGYTTQRAVYREAIHQKFGVVVVPYIAAVSKEKVPDYRIYEFDKPLLLDAKFEDFREYLPYVVQVLTGEIAAPQCGTCDYCKKDKIVTGVKKVPDSDY